MSPRAGLSPASVIAEAGALADAEGLEAVTLTALAARVGVRPPSLYKHVASLDDVHRGIALAGVTELHEILLVALAGRAGEDALRALAHAWRDWSTSHPGRYAATVRAWPEDEAIGAVSAGILELVRAALRDRQLGADDLVHAARTIRSALHGFCGLQLACGFGLPTDLDDSFEVLIGTLARGLPGPA